ncbi:MAG: LysM peptidoglycan-binding domain-containing protein [Firmicutes bacterium]|nr:LysM peptidoglycan-binding domain-containing protein [Bacillota bacterium]
MAKNKKTGKKNKKLEDTLDYYNEKTTKKVVEELLAGIDDEDEEEPPVSEEDDDEQESGIDYDDANIYSRRRSRGRKASEEIEENTEETEKEEDISEKEDTDDGFADDYEQTESKDGNMTTRFIMVAMAALFLIVLTVFAVSLNNTKKELAQAQQQLTAAKISTGSENNAVDTEVKPAISQSDEKLKKENENLKLENEKLKKQIGEMQTSEDKENKKDDNEQQNNAGGENENVSSDPIIPDTYVVQENDNFAKISEKLYGTQNYYLQIAEYNGMSPDEPLSIGTVIRIPIPEY